MVLRIRISQLLILFTLIATLTGLSGAAQALSVDNLRIGQHPEKTRLVFELSDVADYRVFTLSGPYRIVVDMPRFSPKFSLQDKLRESGSSVIKNIRHGNLNAHISRMVIDMSGAVKIDSTFVLPAKSSRPARLVVDFARTSPEIFASLENRTFGTLTFEDIQQKTASSAAVERTHKAAASVPPTRPPRRTSKPVIIIDPGHGGVDPGAVGYNGVYEKDIVLKLSHELRKQLEATGRFKIKMTRRDDRFLRLRDRVAFARRHKGDLFISFHADSLKNSAVSGASVYTLSETASDKQTARLAQRENRADLIAGVDLATEGRDVANILIDLAMRDTMNQSSYFAETLVASMKTSRINILENPHRFAGFAVLKAADIPSVLIEAGFLSNKNEARKLVKAAYRREVARAIVKGIMEHYEQIERNQRT